MYDGARAVKVLALGARAVGFGRAALVAVDEDPEHGLIRFMESLALEMRLLISALGKYAAGEPGPEDLWGPPESRGAASHDAPRGAGESPIRHDKREVFA